MKFYRGATPTHRFKLPFSADNLKSARISYAQNDIVMVRKYLDECQIDGNTISVKLTEDDTMSFESKTPVEVQMMGRTYDGTKVISPIVTVGVNKIVDDTPLP